MAKPLALPRVSRLERWKMRWKLSSLRARLLELRTPYERGYPRWICLSRFEPISRREWQRFVQRRLLNSRGLAALADPTRIYLVECRQGALDVDAGIVHVGVYRVGNLGQLPKPQGPGAEGRLICHYLVHRGHVTAIPYATGRDFVGDRYPAYHMQMEGSPEWA